MGAEAGAETALELLLGRGEHAGKDESLAAQLRGSAKWLKC